MIKRIALTAVAVAIVSLMPTSADASLIGVAVTGEFSLDNFVTTVPLGSPVIADAPIDFGPFGTGGAPLITNQADFHSTGGHTLTIQVTNTSTSEALDAASRYWRFTNLAWLNDPSGTLDSVQTNNANNSTDATVFGVNDTSFSVFLTGMDGIPSQGGTLTWVFTLFPEHGPGPGIPVPGTLALLGLGLAALARRRR